MAKKGTKRPERRNRARLSARVEQSPAGFADRMRFCARRVGSGDELARRAGIPRRTLQSYLAGGREPKLSKLLAIAHAAQVPVAWLAAGQPPFPSDGERAGEGRFGLAEEAAAGFLAENGFARPPRGVLPLSSEHPLRSAQIVDVLAFRLDWLREIGVAPDRMALVRVLGDSMQPTIGEGDVVLLDLSAKAVRDNALYALWLEGTLVVKRIQLLARSGLRLISDNPAYPPEEITGEHAGALDVVGRVVWHGRAL